MTITNAIKKIEAKTQTEVIKIHGVFTAPYNDRVIEFTQNGRDDDVATIRVRYPHDNDDSMSDYSAGAFFDNLSQAIRFCEGR
jgi:hypothetical protein